MRRHFEVGQQLSRSQLQAIMGGDAVPPPDVCTATCKDGCVCRVECPAGYQCVAYDGEGAYCGNGASIICDAA
jgi:hypothetical protein